MENKWKMAKLFKGHTYAYYTHICMHLYQHDKTGVNIKKDTFYKSNQEELLELAKTEFPKSTLPFGVTSSFSRPPITYFSY